MPVSSSTPVSTVTVGPIEGSQKQYLTVPGTDGDLHVPFRRIALTNGDHHDVYDTSGPYTQYVAEDQLHDLAEGLPKTRDAWNKPAAVDGASTQLAWARAGIITDEMRFVAAREGFDPEKVDPNGSGISLGHPVGATGARIVVTAAHHLRRTGGKRALVTMCIGGGQGLAAIVEAV